MDGCRKVEVLRNEASVPDNFMFEDKCSNSVIAISWLARMVLICLSYNMRRAISMLGVPQLIAKMA